MDDIKALRALVDEAAFWARMGVNVNPLILANAMRALDNLEAKEIQS
jgi:hypothetical protein